MLDGPQFDSWSATFIWLLESWSLCVFGVAITGRLKTYLCLGLELDLLVCMVVL